MGCSHNDTRGREEFELGKEHGFGSCFLLLDALFGATALPLFVRGNAFAFWYKLRRRLNNNSLSGPCPDSLSNIKGLTLVYVLFSNSA
ncbi:hypothetical protein GW17_00004681 [Ensete ventricosum]|nr:hypothetical protein GW17_00004681 [Ensete ventricosum]